MKVKLTSLIIVANIIILSSLAFPVHASEKSHYKAAMKLVKLSNYKELSEKLGDKIFEVIVKQNPSLASFSDIIQEHINSTMNYKYFEADYADIYMKLFTEKEINEIAAFRATDAGKKLIKLTPEVYKRGNFRGQNRAKSMLPGLIEKIKQRLLVMKKQQDERARIAEELKK